MDNLTVYNLPTAAGPRWDRLGIFYISFCCIWSTLVVAGMVFCWFNRHTPVMKIRGMLLSFTAISFLHAYWILAQITYPIAATIPIVLAYDIQYFFMGIWFPLGIALFHASNCRFLHIAKLQKQFTYPTLQRRADGCNGQKTSFLCRLRNISYSYRIMIFIGIGMVAQVSHHILCHEFPNASNRRRFFSPWACGSLARSTILHMVFLALRCTPRPCQSRSLSSAEAGSGGHPSYGNSSGLGS